MHESTPDWSRWYCYLVIGFLLLSMAVAMQSLIPQLHMDLVFGRRKRDKTKSIVFFGDIAEMKPEAFLNAVKEEFGKTHIPTTFEQDLANQIVVNARIAVRKLESFELAANFALAAIISPVFWLVLLGISKNRRNRMTG